MVKSVTNVKIEYILLFLVVLLGLFLRVYRLSDVPTGFFCDEASIGYNAYTLLTTGKDEYGIPHPIFLKAFGEYKNPVETYSTIPFIAIFGLTEFATRLPSSLYGSLGIIAIFLLTQQLFIETKRKQAIALFAAVCLMLSPWDIHMSRIAMEGFMPYILFTVLGTYFFLKSRRKEIYLPIAAICFCVAIYCYFPARIFIPILVLGLGAIFFSSLWAMKKYVFISIFIGILLLIPLLQATFGGNGLARFNQVSIFSHPPTQQTVNQHIIDNYLSNLSPDFLFIKGDIGMPGEFITRHSVKGYGELYVWQVFFIFTGFLFLIYRRHWQTFFLLLLWILVYPLSSAFTLDQSVQATRSVIGVIPWQILTSFGVIELSFFLFKNKVLNIGYFVILFLVIFFFALAYTKSYFITYPLYSADFWGWQYGPKEIVSFFVSHEKQYDNLYMSGEFNAPEIFLKFYAPHDCERCHIGVPDQYYIPGKKQLFAVTPAYLLAHTQYHFHTLQTIYYPNQTIAFKIGEIIQ